MPFFLNELYLTLVSGMCPSLNFISGIWVNAKDYSEAMDRIQDTPPISLLPEWVGSQSHRVNSATPSRAHRPLQAGLLTRVRPGEPSSLSCGTHVPEAIAPEPGALHGSRDRHGSQGHRTEACASTQPGGEELTLDLPSTTTLSRPSTPK